MKQRNVEKTVIISTKKEDYEDFLQKKELLMRIRHAVNHNYEGFEAYFQPIMDVRQGRLSGAETLLRFHTKEQGYVLPYKFIPLLEESGLIIPVGKWVLDQSAKVCSEIRKQIPDFRISVNISYVQVLKSNILDDILEVLEKYHLNTNALMIELTESGMLEMNDNFIAFCDGLKEHHISLALDDFGTGYSNFCYLFELYPSTIKIDRSFTLKALKSDNEYHLLQHMVNMTHSIDLKLCIEGIETKDELAKISGISPDYIQGYYFGKPCDYVSFKEAYIR